MKAITRGIYILIVSMMSFGLLAVGDAGAATINKNNTGNDLWLGTSWMGGVAPGASDIAQWETNDVSVATSNLGNDRTWLGIKVLNPGVPLVTINNNILTLGASGIDLSQASADLTRNSTLTLGAAQEWTVPAGRTFTFGGNITGGGFTPTIKGSGYILQSSGGWGGTGSGITLDSTFTGTMQLGPGNSFTGVVTINGGKLVALGNAGTMLGSGTVALNGGTLVLAAYDGDRNLGRNTTVSGAEATLISDLGSSDFTGHITTMGTLSIGGTTLNVLGVRATSAVAMRLLFGNTTLTGNPTFNIVNPPSGTEMRLSLGAIASMGNTITVTGNGNLVQTGVWGGGAGGVVQHANFAGTNTLSQANTFTGGVTVNGGTLQIGNAAALGNVAGTLTLAGGALDVTGAIVLNNHPQSWNGDFTFKGFNTLNLGTGNVTLGATSVVTVNASTLTVGGIISGGFGLTKAGAGILSLRGANSYSGDTTVQAGTLTLDYTVQNNSKLADAGTLVFSGGTLTLTAGTHTDVVAATTVDARHSTVTRSSGTSVLRLNAITRTLGATINFSTAGITDTDRSTVNGILGGWAVLGNEWAISSASASDTPITALATYQTSTTPGTWAATDNVKINSAPGTAGTLTINSLNFASGQTLTQSGGTTITLTSGGILSSQTATITGGTIRGASGADLILTSTANTLTIASIIADNTSPTMLTKSGAGQVTLSTAANTYNGGTTINSGVLQLGAASGGTENVAALGTGPVTVNAGATLQFRPGGSTIHYLVTNSVTLNGGTVAATDGHQHLTNGVVTIGAAGGTLSSSYSDKFLYIDSELAGSGPLTLTFNTTSGSRIYISNPANTYNGTVSVMSGVTLYLRHSLALANATVNLASAGNAVNFADAGLTTATFGGISGNQGLSMPNGFELKIGGNNLDATYTGALTSGALWTLHKQGSGTLTLAGNGDNSWLRLIASGGTTMLAKPNSGSWHAVGTGLIVTNGATVRWDMSGTGNDQMYDGTSPVTIYSGLVDLNDKSETIQTLTMSGGTLQTGIGVLTLGGDVTYSLNGGAETSAQVTGKLTLNGNRNFTIADGVAATDMDVTANITSAANSITKSGLGTLALSGQNGFSAGVNLNAGVLSVAVIEDTTGSGIGPSGTLTLNGGTLRYTGAGNGWTARNVAPGSGVSTVEVANVSGNLYLALVNGTSSSFYKTGAGTLTLNGSANNGNATAVVSAGTLALGKSGSVYAIGGGLTVTGGTVQFIGSSANQINDSSGIIIDGASAVVSLGAFNEQVNAFRLAGGGQLTGSGGTLTSTGAFDVRDGSITANLAGGVALNKTTADAVTLTGANTYSGGTTISSGTLLVNNGSGSGLGSGAVAVNNGALLGGTGNIDAAVTVNSGGTVAAGVNVGTLTVDALTLAAGSTNVIEFNTSPANDQIVVANSGGLTINGGAVYLYEEGTSTPWVEANTYNLIQYTGAIGGTGVSALSVANPQFGQNYTFGTSGGWVTLTISAPLAPGGPEITTGTATGILANVAWLDGSLSSTGGYSTAVSVYWGATPGGTTKADWAATNEFGYTTDVPPVAYTHEATGLTSGGTYYFRYYATNQVGDAWGTTASFSTPEAPQVTSLSATGTTSTATWMNGTLVADGGASTTVRLYWKDGGDAGTVHDGWASTSSWSSVASGTGFTVPVGSLAPLATYTYRYYATNVVTESWGAPITVNTLTLEPITRHIGMNFSGDGSWAMVGTQSAGAVVASTNWNNLLGANGTLGTINYNDGTASGISVTWSDFEGTYRSDTSSANGDERMMLGYPDNTDGDTGKIVVTGITADEYDVYVYFGSDGDGRTGTIGIGGSSTFSYNTYSGPSHSFPSGYVITTDTGVGYPNANYAAWSNLTGGSFTVTLTRGSNNSGPHGLQIVSRTAQRPAITTGIATGVTANAAWLDGNLTSTLGSPTAVSLYWGTNNGASVKANWGNTNAVASGVVSAPVAYTEELTGLAGGTTYYFQYYASNIFNDAWGNTASFQTLAQPTITSDAVSSLLDISATLNGTLVTNGGSDTTVQIYWRAGSDLGTVYTGWAATGTWSSVASGTALATNLTGLTISTGYTYRYYATNALGEDWGDAVSFTTLSGPPLTRYLGINLGADWKTMAPSDIAGAVVTNAGWNNIAGTNGASGALTFSDGGASAITFVRSNFEGTYGARVGGVATNGHERMMWGYIDNSLGSSATIAISGITADEYDVYAYFGSDGDDRGGTVGISGAPTYSYRTRSRDRSFEGAFIQTTDTGLNYPQATFAAWSNRTDSSFTLTITANTVYNSGLNGIQLVLRSAPPEEPPVLDSAVSVTGLTYNAVWANGTLTSTGSQQTAVWLFWGASDPGPLKTGWSETEIALGDVTTAVPPDLTLTHELTGLVPLTSYAFRYLASNSVDEVWSDAGLFSTPAISGGPAIANLPPTGITPNAADLNGDLTSTGDTDTVVWVFWGDTDLGPTVSGWNGGTLNFGTNTVGPTTYTTNVTGLTPNSLYHYRYYASNSVAAVWSAATSFQTIGAPTITSGAVSGLGTTAATFNGTLATNGGLSTTVRVYWKDGGDLGTVYTGWASTSSWSDVASGTALSTNMSGLNLVSPYTYRFYATNSVGESWGAAQSFSTLAPEPVVSYIGLNFGADYRAMAPMDSAGAVVAFTNWNNITGTNGASSGFVLNDGSAAGITVTRFGFEGAYSARPANLSSNGDENMMWGYLDNNIVDDPNRAATVTVSNISVDEYDVYAYFGSDGETRKATITIAGREAYSFQTRSRNRSFPSEYLRTTDTGTGFPLANYAVWTNVTGTNFTLSMRCEPGGPNFASGLNGIQIVQRVDGRPAVNTTVSVTGLTSTAVWANGTVTSTGTASTAVWVYWGTSDPGPTRTGWSGGNVSVGAITDPVPPSRPVTALLSGLTPDAGYSFRVLATNAYGEAWSDAIHFDTVRPTTVMQFK